MLRTQGNIGKIFRPVTECPSLIEVGATNLRTAVLASREPMQLYMVRIQFSLRDKRLDAQKQ